MQSAECGFDRVQVTVVQVPARGAGGRPHLLLEWEGGTLGDMVADAAVAIILQARCATRRRTRRKAGWTMMPRCTAGAEAQRASRLESG